VQIQVYENDVLIQKWYAMATKGKEIIVNFSIISAKVTHLSDVAHIAQLNHFGINFLL
jgi:hypothetical protein